MKKLLILLPLLLTACYPTINFNDQTVICKNGKRYTGTVWFDYPEWVIFPASSTEREVRVYFADCYLGNS